MKTICERCYSRITLTGADKTECIPGRAVVVRKLALLREQSEIYREEIAKNKEAGNDIINGPIVNMKARIDSIVEGVGPFHTVYICRNCANEMIERWGR